MGLKDKARAPKAKAKPKAAGGAGRRKRTPKKKATKSAAAELASGVVADLKKRVKNRDTDGTIGLLADDFIMEDVLEFISTGFPGLDDILGGGWAVGRCSEVYGPEGGGKSALSHMATLSCQQAGGVVLFLDGEHSLDPLKIKQLGIIPELLVYARPRHMEMAVDLIFDFLTKLRKQKPAAPALIVLDSIGGTPMKSEVTEASITEAHVAEAARLLSKFCRRVFYESAQARCHVMLINQERSKVGKTFGFGENVQTFGGRAVKFAATQRVRVTRVMQIKANANSGAPSTGYLVKAKTDKNRCAPPHQSAVWVLDFKYGPSPDLTMRQVLMDANMIVASGTRINRRTAYCLKLAGVPVKERAKFTKGQWLTMLEDAAFREQATTLYLEVVRAGGSLAVLKAAEAEDTEEPEDAYYPEEEAQDGSETGDTEG